ncbi:hypothetical protein ACQKKX_17645 [Neorhizobium sp. NPDC001467]|uniref:hypothetical protein n=1 Tax=Neorhizobium sp. NPDC001467 TaxID=3390595 RepID=UPI003D013818
MARKRTNWMAAAGAMGLMVLLPHMASAQNPVRNRDNPASQSAPPAATPECVAPADPSQKGDRLPQGDAGASGQLDKCNGVLTPPQTGDPDIVTPAPDTGKARVIAPDEMPAAGNPSNGSGQ